MSTCNVDHTSGEVMAKLQSQQKFLPQSLYERIVTYLEQEQSQNDLNELFHFLKKYDLVPTEEQELRNVSMSRLIS